MKKTLQEVHGIVLFDKPKGMSSHYAMQKVRRCFSAKKAGHGGTLDPMATGLLPICLGEATKFSMQLLDANKSYEFTCHLGASTDTGDAEGVIIDEKPLPIFNEAMINEVLQQFLGVITQIPPMHSALHHQGKRLYELARQGIEVERKPRHLTIHQLELLAYDHSSFTVRASCSKGTYIRVLAEDIAKSLGSCGHLTMLRRISINPFENPNLCQLDDLVKDPERFLLPLDSCLSTLPKIVLASTEAARFLQGQRIRLDQVLDEALIYRVYDENDCFLGTGNEHHKNVLAAKRLVASSLHPKI